MPVGVDCPSCQHKFMIPDKMHGRGVKCPRCEHSFTAVNGAVEQPPQADLPMAPVVSDAPAEVPVAAPAPPPPAPIPLPLPPQGGTTPTAQGITSQWPDPPPPAAPRRRGLTRLVLDLPENMLKTMPKPLKGITGVAVVALAAGLLAWALTNWIHMTILALALAALGLLFGGVAVAALAKRQERGPGLPIPAGAVQFSGPG